METHYRLAIELEYQFITLTDWLRDKAQPKPFGLEAWNFEQEFLNVDEHRGTIFENL